MTTPWTRKQKRESSLLSDFFWALFVSGVGIFLVYALVSIINVWSGSSLKGQFLGY